MPQSLMACGILRLRHRLQLTLVCAFDDNRDDNPRKKASSHWPVGDALSTLAQQPIHRFHRRLLHV
ncbi:MAG TPA: hypothetical protein VHI51_17635, partial [Ktedonobacterales bacterium]|nr:hypothetical protein [Ktedonobacterales bacterium]